MVYLLGELDCEAEVRYLHIAFEVIEEVVTLDVAMDDLLIVQEN